MGAANGPTGNFLWSVCFSCEKCTGKALPGTVFHAKIDAVLCTRAVSRDKRMIPSQYSRAPLEGQKDDSVMRREGMTWRSSGREWS